MNNGKGLSAKGMITAIETGQGYVSKACNILKCSRQTWYNYEKKYPTVRQKVEDIREERHDFVENKLMTQIKDDNITAIIFYLKTQCKDRGYVERQEITGEKGEGLKVLVEYVNSPITAPGITPGTGDD